MSKINEILNFNFSSASFALKGKNIIPLHVELAAKARILILQELTRKLGTSMLAAKPSTGLREVFLKFNKVVNDNNGLIDKFDKRELRILTYSLNYSELKANSIFDDPNHLRKAIYLLNNNWRDSYISGLLDCYLSKWNCSNPDSMDLLFKIIREKLMQYSGSRDRFVSLKSKIKFLERGRGDVDLGATLALLKKPITEVVNELQVPDDWISYSYFEGVFIGYFEKSKHRLEEILDDFVNVLNAHSNSVKATDCNKIIVSKIICYVDQESVHLQDKVKDIAFRLVGDPGVISHWYPSQRINESDRNTIKKGREILNIWLTQQFINVFFEKCINDNRRKRFWLKYTGKISTFKVFGPNRIKKILKGDMRITDYVDGRFQAVDSKRDVSAFMFLMGNYKFIEFSDPGYAFYAYHNSNENAPSLDNKGITSVDVFRDGNMPFLVYRNGRSLHSYANEGRLSHNDGDLSWENVFSNWLIRKAGINV